MELMGEIGVFIICWKIPRHKCIEIFRTEEIVPKNWWGHFMLDNDLIDEV